MGVALVIPALFTGSGVASAIGAVAATSGTAIAIKVVTGKLRRKKEREQAQRARGKPITGVCGGGPRK